MSGDLLQGRRGLGVSWTWRYSYTSYLEILYVSQYLTESGVLLETDYHIAYTHRKTPHRKSTTSKKISLPGKCVKPRERRLIANPGQAEPGRQ